MTITENFLKTYTDKTYQHTTMVRHKGTVVSLAMDQQRRIYYSVLNLNDDKPDSPLDVNYWLENPQKLQFPNEISQVGYAIADSTLMPIVKKGSREEAERGKLRLEEIDPFLSSTARLTANAPFQALSDEKYIYIFRQSIDNNHEDTVFKLDKLPSQASGDSTRTDYVTDVDDQKVPLVKDTLLVDRFILAGTQLNPKMEVRYKRSRSKTNALNGKDSLGAKDMEGNPFFEPTQELDFISNLQQGRFSALLVPTQIANVQRWQIFAHNSRTGLIDSFNIERTADGFFNTKGTQFYTSPDPQYQKSVFERQPGTCPFTDEDLIPLVSKEGYAESALQFDGHDDYVDFGQIDFARGNYTIEGWFKTSESEQANSQMAIATSRKADHTYGISLELLSDGRLRYLHRSNNTDYSVNSIKTYNDGKWHYFAAVKDDSEQKLYLDGILVATSTVDSNLTEVLSVVIGRLGNSSERYFKGQIDEVRIWQRARSTAEIKTDINHRLVGNEPGLTTYWRFDEGSGDTVYDQTTNASHGTIHGDTIWVDSNVPLGDHPGIRRTSFSFEGRTIESGLASLLYYQQEKTNAGYDPQQKPIKKNARVMLATATGSDSDTEKYIGVLDFALSREGKLAQVPDNITLPLLTNEGLEDLSRNELLDRISNAEESILRLTSDIQNIGKNMQNITARIPEIEEEIAELNSQNTDLERELEVSKDYRYVVKTNTSSLSGADTDDTVYLTLMGSLKNSDERRLDSSGDDFKKGRQDQYILEDIDNIGSLKKIKLRLSGSDGWRVEEVLVEIYRKSTGALLETLTFDFNLLLDSGSNAVQSAIKEPRQASTLRDSSQINAAIVQNSAQRNSLTTEKSTKLSLRTEYELDKVNKENELIQQKQRLIDLKSQQANADPIKMSILHMDTFGLTVSGSLLSFAYTNDTPQLFDSALGKLALYFRGRTGQFFAAYYDTNTAKAQYTLSAETDSISFLARTAEPELDSSTITVSAGTDADNCTVVLENTSMGITETWNQVPRNVAEFSAVLNGVASKPVFVATLATELSGTTTSLNLADKLKQVVKNGDTLLVGETKVTVSGDVARGATAIPVTSTSLDVTATTLINLLPYDYETLATTNQPTHNLQKGSLLFIVNPGIAKGKVQNGTAINDGITQSCVWVADSPGKAYAFDGENDYIALGDNSQLGQLAASNDVTLEAWVNCQQVGNTSRLIHHHSAESQYSLVLKRGGTSEAYSIVAGVGNRFIKSESELPCDSWQHLAAVFNQSYGLDFNGGYLKCGKERSLNISQDLTIEIFLKTSTISQKQGLISKGQLQDGTDEDVPYALFIDRDRKLVFAFEDKNHQYYQYKATTSLSNNSFQKIALVRKRGQKTQENKETKSFVVNGESVTMDTVASVDFEKWDDIKFYIDNSAAGNYRFEGEVGTNEQQLEIGRVVSSSKESYFPGIMSEVRVWNKALDQKDLYSEMKGEEQGLIAWWRFEENEGNIAYDTKGTNHGNIIGGVEWVKNPDINGSKFQLYLNGQPVKTTTPSSLSWGSEQFTLGAYKNGSSFLDPFEGTLEEIRIWKVARTQEQIQDNLFTRLKGEKQDLIANYSFDLDDETELKDSSLLGSHLVIGTDESEPTSVLSTAPISNDIAQVRSALAGVKTQFHDTIDSRPAVQEYGDMQYDSEGNLTGVMKRCYTYIKDGQWHLFTGYKVGNLITEWIGQAQFNPQVIGYIEGAPPVPSENMTENTGDSYTDCSTVTFTQADEVMYNYSTSKENGFNSSFGISGEMGVDLDLRTLLAPLGFGISQKMEFNLGISSSASFEASGTWSEEQSMSSGRNVSRDMSVFLSGNWEDPNQIHNPAIGRRWLSGNNGFALVQSETADIFALRLAHNNALVSLQFKPNPDIPKDWNIISFPLNPRYTTQGTLDGKIGYKEDGSVCTDANYPQATTYGEYSYFKPKEAYTLKKSIAQEMQELQNYYDNFDTSPLSANNSMNKLMKSNASLLDSAAGAGPGASQAMAAGSVFGSVGDALAKDQSIGKKFAKRNLANTYVWTADGGFYAETTNTIDVVQDSVSGSYSFNNEFSSGLSLSFSALGADFGFGLDSSMGGSLNITKTKSKEASKSFSIDLSIAPSGDMQAFDADGEPIYENGQPKLAVGRVDAYRFMTFYLDSDKENFEDLFSKVVDPIWLEQSDHPNAVAMRQANQAEKKPGCWRLMHRVTFVSRVLPEFDSPTAPPLESAMKAENIDSNYELIKKLEPFVKNKTGNYIEFADAVRNTLKVYLPELQPHKEDIIKYAALYFGVEEAI